MYLREIELKGFKSFAEKIVLQFPKGVSAIVGPNGSGKSNVVDALRWVLGEQSSKSLRIDNNTNLIFSGNEFKPAGQFAKIKLVFDEINSPEIIDCQTIEIEKTLSRDGKMEYFLNKKDIKQKDLVELLASLQLGTKGLSIVSQGSIENILKVSPFDRKIMFEEVLGLRQLELKKESSQKKLENTALNLDKVTSLVNEILPHFRSLKRYVSRFEKQSEFKTELFENSVKYYGFKYQFFTNKNNENKNQISILNSKILELDNTINEEKQRLGLDDNSKNSQISILNQQQKDIENDIRSLNSKKQGLVYEMAKLEGQVDEKIATVKRLQNTQTLSNQPQVQKPKLIDLNLIESKLQNIKVLFRNIFESTDIHQIKSIILSIENELADILSLGEKNITPNIHSDDNTSKINELNIEIAGIQSKVSVFKNEIETIDISIKEKDKEVGELENSIENESQKQREMFSFVEEKQKEKMNIQNQLQSLKLEEEKNNMFIENLKNQVSSMNLDFNTITTSESLKDLTLNEHELNELYNKIEKLRATLNELGFVDQNIIDEYNDTQKRLEFLESQKSDLEKAILDLQKIIKELTQHINSQFEEAIKEINKGFNKYLELIFGGGKGNLEIVEFKERIKQSKEEETQEKEDIERKIGIDIKVKLPKTKLEGVEALSGGEKSLVSIALLFAIVSQSKPPLLVLDEVDAALDEENTRKFANILKDLSSDTQYLIITHNWLTMSSAKVIYGVTIGTDKVSQILSLELDDSREFMKN